MQSPTWNGWSAAGSEGAAQLDLAHWSVWLTSRGRSLALSPPGESLHKISPNLFLWACHLPRLSPTAVTGQFKCGAPVNTPHLLTAPAQETTGSHSGQACPPPGKSPSFYLLLGFSPGAAPGECLGQKQRPVPVTANWNHLGSF